MLGGQRKRRIDRAIILAEERPRMASASLTNRQSSYGQESRIEYVNYLRIKQLYIENFSGAQDLLKFIAAMYRRFVAACISRAGIISRLRKSRDAPLGDVMKSVPEYLRFLRSRFFPQDEFKRILSA